MAYKDKDKQREANAERQRRYKARSKALPEQGVTSEKALLSEGVTDKALPKVERTAQGNIRVSKPGDADYEPQCETKQGSTEGVTRSGTRFIPDCSEDLPNTEFPKTTRIPTHKQDTAKCSQMTVKGSTKVTKRGKDIKCFEDLPPHVQQTIDMMSIVDGKTDNTVFANRTAIAINYQHQFPDRYHSTGV